MRRGAATLAVAAAVLAGCSTNGSAGNGSANTTASQPSDTNEPSVTSTEKDAVTPSPTETTPEPTTPKETVAEDLGVVAPDEPIVWSDSGYELEVEAVRIVSVEEMTAITGEEVEPYLSNDEAVTLVGFRTSLRNTTDTAVDWYPAGIQTAIVLAGQQGEVSPIGDTGSTIRGEAEATFSHYFESTVPVDEAREAGEVRWDVGSPVDPDSYQPVAEVGELTIPYTF